jgi:calcineurin-like phosphoesterase family protein
MSNLPNPFPKIPSQSNKKRKLWLTADEHYHHKKILAYQSRPFKTVEEMDNHLITQHNELVRPEDWTIHIGDFAFGHAPEFARLVEKLNGFHAFLDGSHDRAMKEFFENPTLYPTAQKKCKLLPKLFEFQYNQHKITLCHYAMRTWWASHYGSLHFHGHSHGKLSKGETFRDVGVDTTNYQPILIENAIKSLANSKMPA